MGCYIVSADNGIGPIIQQRGYIDVKQKSFQHLKQSNYSNSDFEEPLFATLVGVMVVLLFCILILKFYKKKQTFTSLDTEKQFQFVRTVYLSHCAESKKEEVALMKFVGALRTFGVDVIVDVLNQVEINNVGGASRWIQINILKAEKLSFCLITSTKRHYK